MSFIEGLHKAADTAADAEMQFRRAAAERIAALENERAFAFRRLSLMRAVADAARRAENEEAAVAAGIDALRSKLDWPNDSEAQSAILSRFEPVAQALFASLKAGEQALDKSAGEALAQFEQWYAQAYRAPFWALFEQAMAETPRVDF